MKRLRSFGVSLLLHLSASSVHAEVVATYSSGKNYCTVTRDTLGNLSLIYQFGAFSPTKLSVQAVKRGTRLFHWDSDPKRIAKNPMRRGALYVSLDSGDSSPIGGESGGVLVSELKQDFFIVPTDYYPSDYPWGGRDDPISYHPDPKDFRFQTLLKKCRIVGSKDPEKPDTWILVFGGAALKNSKIGTLDDIVDGVGDLDLTPDAETVLSGNHIYGNAPNYCKGCSVGYLYERFGESLIAKAEERKRLPLFRAVMKGELTAAHCSALRVDKGGELPFLSQSSSEDDRLQAAIRRAIHSCRKILTWSEATASGEAHSAK